MSVRKYPDVPRVYVDMDGPLANFEAYCQEIGKPPKETKLLSGTYLNLPPVSQAIESVSLLLDLGYFVMVLTKIPSQNPGAASEKIFWLRQHFPVLKDHIIITPDKGCVGTKRDFLIDDHPEWANADTFKGEIITFEGPKGKSWNQIAALFKRRSLQHVCGLQGFNGMLGDTCPACEADRAERA